MLTAKQELFVQNIIEGKSQADAYRAAYNTKRMSDNSIYVNASKLMSDTKVALRIKELREELAKPSIMTAQERLEWLTEVVKDTEQAMCDRLKASDQMNRMQGQYIQKIEADVKNEVTINIELSDD